MTSIRSRCASRLSLTERPGRRNATVSRLTKAPMRSSRSSTSYDQSPGAGRRPRTSKTPPNSQCDGLSRAWASEKMNRRLKSSRLPRHEFHLTQSSHERARTSIGYSSPFHTAQWSLHTVGSRSPVRLLSGITAATLAKLLQSLTKADIENLLDWILTSGRKHRSFQRPGWLSCTRCCTGSLRLDLLAAAARN